MMKIRRMGPAPELLVILIACGTAGKAGAQAVDPGPSPGRPAGWRGDGSGRFPSADPLTRWSAGENILWKTEVGAGHSSPILVGRRLLITSEPDVLVCLDAETGREMWRKAHKLADVSAEAVSKGAKHSSQYGDANPTPVSDGRCVWAFFGTGLVACHDLEGKRRWMDWYDLRQTTGYGRTSSPVLVGDRLLVHFGPLVCLEAATGKVLWKNDEARATYGTPVATRIGDVDVVVTPKGQVVRVTDGKILAADLGNCMYASPVVQDRVAYFIDGGMTAAQLPEKAGEMIECKEFWSAELTGEFFASPLVDRGRIYTADKAGNFYVIDASTGKVILKRQIEFAPAADAGGASVYPSLCLPGKAIFIGNDAGKTVVIEPGDGGVLVGSGSLPAGSGGTPTFSGRRVFARGGAFLYCIAAASLPATGLPAAGPLRVHPTNPRYFADGYRSSPASGGEGGSGKAVYLTGSHTWNDLQDVTGDSWFLPNLISRHGYEAYLDFLASRNHNFIRLWMVEHAWDEKEKSRIAPHPWMRTGPGTALDGLPRFDLNRADQAFYDRLRERVIAARDRGIYVSVMLFGGMWGTEHRSTWKGHPFNRENNVNGIDGDANRDGLGNEIYTLAIVEREGPWTGASGRRSRSSSEANAPTARGPTTAGSGRRGGAASAAGRPRTRAAPTA
jgi:outer membrane protein assembly factor BamB